MQEKMGVFSIWLMIMISMNFQAGIPVAEAAAPEHHHAGGELKQGRYVGYLEFATTKKKLSTVVDFYLESPEDFRNFPRLNAVFKYSFGGFGTHEYFTETFIDLKYDFDNGVLTLDEDGNDFTFSTVVHTMGEKEDQTMIMGSFFERTTGQQGRVYLVFVPEDSQPQLALDNQFMSRIEGQYVGQCGSKKANFQIQTGRGLVQGDITRKMGFEKYYQLGARLAYKDRELCGLDRNGNQPWCTIYHFNAATLNLFLGHIIFEGNNVNQECSINSTQLKCVVRNRNGIENCSLDKVDRSIKAPAFFARKLHVQPSNEERRELPAPMPPSNADLTEALKGTFTGWLHNETNDTYQVVALNVFPYSSTENPHNPNQMMITTSLYRYFDKTNPIEFINERFLARSFYLRPGFVLTGPTADSFIHVLEWRRGYIRGMFYSREFGRVGTVELIKGDKVPSQGGQGKGVPSFTGEYVSSNASLPGQHWLNIFFVPSSMDSSSSVAHFKGNYQFVKGDTAMAGIRSGSYDPYTGRLAMLMDLGTTNFMVNGLISSSGGLQLYWPPNPTVYGAYMRELIWETYKPVRKVSIDQ